MADVKKTAILVAMFLFGWSTSSAANDAPSIKTKMINAKGQQVGEATLTETPNGLLLRLNLSPKHAGIDPGTHAFHIHEVGKCEAPFKSAGGHFNPANKQHGFLDQKGKHAGDLPNLHVPKATALTVEYLVPDLTLSSGEGKLLDSDGSSLVVHKGADDYHTDPAGDAGDRVACGVIESAAKAK